MENALKISDCSFNRDHEHMRRLRKVTFLSNMSAEFENILSEVSQKAFLSSSNKQQTKTHLLANYPIISGKSQRCKILR